MCESIYLSESVVKTWAKAVKAAAGGSTCFQLSLQVSRPKQLEDRG